MVSRLLKNHRRRFRSAAVVFRNRPLRPKEKRVIAAFGARKPLTSKYMWTDGEVFTVAGPRGPAELARWEGSKIDLAPSYQLNEDDIAPILEFMSETFPKQYFTENGTAVLEKSEMEAMGTSQAHTAYEAYIGGEYSREDALHAYWDNVGDTAMEHGYSRSMVEIAMGAYYDVWKELMAQLDKKINPETTVYNCSVGWRGEDPFVTVVALRKSVCEDKSDWYAERAIDYEVAPLIDDYLNETGADDVTEAEQKQLENKLAAKLAPLRVRTERLGDLVEDKEVLHAAAAALSNSGAWVVVNDEDYVSRF